MKLKNILIGVLLTLCTTSYARDMSQCNAISDGDQKQMCRAQASGNSSECGFIQSNDLKYLCTAQVGNKKAIADSFKTTVCEPPVKQRHVKSVVFST